VTNRVLFLGGNGHCAARLGPARDALAAVGNSFELIDVPMPGFEGRPRTAAFEEFLTQLAGTMAAEAVAGRAVLVYGTGIGGLLALCLRAEGRFTALPLLLQAPILWGLERRLFPKLMRLGLSSLLGPLFRIRLFQRHFVRTKFLRPLSPELRAAFFDGYARCEALADFFQWLTPDLLRRLERDFAAHPEWRERVRVWWGGHDAVIGLDELAATPDAIKEGWPLRVFPGWGHYPMIDSPGEWIEALADALAAVDGLPRPGGAETE
jgi:pimeloyl-ACP methyl ester carboxylesterase